MLSDVCDVTFTLNPGNSAEGPQPTSWAFIKAAEHGQVGLEPLGQLTAYCSGGPLRRRPFSESKKGAGGERQEGEPEVGVEEAASLRADWLPRPALVERFIRVGAAGRPARPRAPGAAPGSERPTSRPAWPRAGRALPQELAAGRGAREGARGRPAPERAERHAPRQPRLHQVPARLRGDGRRRLRSPARGAPARPAAVRAVRAVRAAPGRRRLPLHVRSPPGAGAGPGGLQRRPLPLLQSAGECSLPGAAAGRPPRSHRHWWDAESGRRAALPRCCTLGRRRGTLKRKRRVRGQPSAGPGALVGGPRALTRLRSAQAGRAGPGAADSPPTGRHRPLTFSGNDCTPLLAPLRAPLGAKNELRST